MSKSGKIRAIPKLEETMSLSKNEATILLPLIRGGNLTVGAISMIVDQPMAKVEKSLQELVSKGLVEEIKGIVPLYRASPPIIPMIKAIEGYIDNSEKIGNDTTSSVQKIQKSTEKTLGSITKANESRFNTLNSTYEKYEKEVVDTVQSHISTMTGLTSEILSEYSQKTHAALDSLNLSLEDNIGQKLIQLQDELDKSQKQLSTDVKKISKEFAKWLAQEKTSSLTSIKDVDQNTKKLVLTAKKVLESALKASEKALQQSTEQIASIIGTKALESSNNVSEILTNLSETLKMKTANFEMLIGQNLTTSRKTLNETTLEAKQNAESHAETMQKRLDEVAGLTQSFTENIDLWKDEVANYMETASQSVLAQLEQLNASEKAFLEIVRSSLSGHIEKMNASIGEEYKSIRNLARTLTSDTDTLMSEARSSVLTLLQNEVTGNKERLEKTNENLQASLASWNEKATKAIDKKITSAVKEISTVLDTEVAELNSLADNMTSRLKSSFSGVISTTETKNDAVVSTIKRTASEYESNLESKLSEIASQYITAIEQQVNEAKVLYESLNQRLNNRMTESMSTLNTQVTRAQKEIDGSITEQVERIDRHAEEMRNDFHTRIEEMTQQFISVTQGMESSFNGLIASQSVEARDLIASAHTEFKTVVKSEMDSLDSDSLKLQQEFASEIGMRIDSVVESTAALKRSLGEFTTDKRIEISESMEDTVSSIEVSLLSVQESLSEIETGTVKQFADNVQQLSREFGVSVAGARDNVTERLKTITTETADLLAKNAVNVKNAVDTYLSEEMESMQRVIGETSKKLDKLAAVNIKKTTEKVEEYFASLETIQQSGSATRTKARDDVMAAVEDRRAETVVAFDAASVWIDSSMDNVAASLETLGSKMSNDVIHAQQTISKSSEVVLNGMRDGTQAQITQFEEVGQSFLQHVDTILKATISEYTASSETSLNSAIDSMSEFPDKVSKETEVAAKGVLSDSKTRFTSAKEETDQHLIDLESSTKTSCDEMNGFIARIESQMIQAQDGAIEQIQQAALVSNQHAARKFESVGIETKAALSNVSFEILEGISSRVSDAIVHIQDVQKTGSSEISAAITNLQSSRTELLKSASGETNESLNDWSENALENTMKLSTAIQDANSSAIDTARNIASMLTAIQEATEEIRVLPSTTTWYLSGTDEICGQIQDMSARAERSIVISIPNMNCLDLKKLAKVKTPTRKVLIIPQSEDKDPELEALKGWRIWELPEPVLLSIVDDREILIGGKSMQDSPICIFSTDDSYLKFYQDVLGPKIVADAIK